MVLSGSVSLIGLISFPLLNNGLVVNKQLEDNFSYQCSYEMRQIRGSVDEKVDYKLKEFYNYLSNTLNNRCGKYKTENDTLKKCIFSRLKYSVSSKFSRYGTIRGNEQSYKNLLKFLSENLGNYNNKYNTFKSLFSQTNFYSRFISAYSNRVENSVRKKRGTVELNINKELKNNEILKGGNIKNLNILCNKVLIGSSKFSLDKPLEFNKDRLVSNNINNKKLVCVLYQKKCFTKEKFNSNYKPYIGDIKQKIKKNYYYNYYLTGNVSELTGGNYDKFFSKTDYILKTLNDKNNIKFIINNSNAFKKDTIFDLKNKIRKLDKLDSEKQENYFKKVKILDDMLIFSYFLNVNNDINKEKTISEYKEKSKDKSNNTGKNDIEKKDKSKNKSIEDNKSKNTGDKNNINKDKNKDGSFLYIIIGGVLIGFIIIGLGFYYLKKRRL